VIEYDQVKARAVQRSTLGFDGDLRLLRFAAEAV